MSLMSLMTLPMAWMKGKRNRTTLQMRKDVRWGESSEIPDPVDSGSELEDPHLEQGLHYEPMHRMDCAKT